MHTKCFSSKHDDNETKQSCKEFHYFEYDLPLPGTFESELLQWLVSLLFKYTFFLCLPQFK